MWWTLILWLFQPVITTNLPVTVTLTAGAGPVDVRYEGQAGDLVTITARSLADEPIDVTLEILRGQQRIAFNDDHQTAQDGLSPQDAAIVDLPLVESGDYTLRIHSFNGAQSGDVEVTVRTQPMIDSCVRPVQPAKLSANTSFACWLDLTAGSHITLTARDTSGTLDPVIGLYDAQESLLVRNDDHTGVDLTLNVLDARIADYTVEAEGTYLVRVSDFSGNAGTFELAVEIES